jgi:uncharacterized protein (TIGR03067 family)
MRPLCVIVLTATAVLSSQSLPDDPVKKDLAQFQGSWQAVSVINADGSPGLPDQVKNTTLVVAGNQFTLRDKEVTVKGRFTIDPTRTPKTIDVVLADQESKGKILGIYRIDGDLRKSCFAMPDQPRPKDFPAQGKGYLQFVWQRQAP